MITTHARTRIETRLDGIITTQDIHHIDRISQELETGKFYIRIKEMRQIMSINGSHGNCITAIIQDGNVKTVMLSERHQRWNDGTFQIIMTR